MTAQKQPDFIAYNVKNYGENKSSWTRIGAAWSNQDGEGINIVIDNVPLDGKITLRTPKPDDQAEEVA